MTSRIQYIDIAKGIGILLVYIGHCYKGECNISNLVEWIYSFHIPLFFFVSGLLFSTKVISAKIFYRHKFSSIIIPYLIFSILHYILRKAFHLGAGAWSIILHGWGSNALWFLPILFLVNCAHFHIYFGKAWEKILALLLLILLLVWKVHTNDWAAYCVSELPWFYFCFVTGFCFKDTIKYIENKKYTWIFGLIGFLLLSVLVFEVAYPYNNNYRHQDNDVTCWALRYLLGFLGTISTILVSISLDKIKLMQVILTWFGRNSLVILCTHQLFYNIFQSINYQPSLQGGYNHILIWMLVILIIFAYNKYVSPIIKKIHR